MALVFGQFLQALQSFIKAMNSVAETDPTELPCGKNRKQVKSEVGRGTAVGECGGRLLLKVVRRQKVILFFYKAGEKMPDLTASQMQVFTLGGVWWFKGFFIDRAADGKRVVRRKKPKHEEDHPQAEPCGMDETNKKSR